MPPPAAASLACMTAVGAGHTGGWRLRIRALDQPGLQREREPCRQRAPRGGCRRPDRGRRLDAGRIAGPVALARAIGWVVIVGLVLMLGTHPGELAGLVHHLLSVLRGAGNELSSFVSRL